MSSYRFNIYKGPIRNTKPEKVMTLYDAMELIKSDRYKEDILRLRAADNPSTRKTLKNCLPYFTFSGVFTKRSNDALKEHSGLMVLDFDDMEADRLAEFKSQVCTIEWVCAAWISPSGNGLKVLVKILHDFHAETFAALSDFFVANFSLDVDASGKDVSRACFASWDPDLYYNPNSEVFYPPNPQRGDNPPDVKKIASQARNNGKGARADGEIDFETQRKIAKDLARVEYVVEQIEREEVDITDNDYDNRLMVGFALATLGEKAYDLYVRAIQYNDYDEDPRAKFNDALHKGKFKTPAKFFALAKDAGINTKVPVTIQEAQRVANAKQIIGDDDNSDDYVKYGIYLKKSTGTYWSLDMKGIPREISNFKMRILYHINTGADEAYRLILIKNVYGLEKVVRINTDDFVSAGSFKKVIARLGNFLFKGADSDLVRLQDMLQRHEKHTEMVGTLGWNKRWGFYAFANGVFDTKKNVFIPIDDYGIVERDDVNFFIPALSKVFADKDDLFQNEKKFIYINGKTSYTEWAEQYVRVFGGDGRIGLVFWVCSLFSDILFKAMGLRMPMPFSYGKRGSGKGTMTQSLSCMWGEKQDQIMLGGATTVVGFMRKMAQFSNGLVWLDEYKNNLPIKVLESIKNLFDRIGYERGKKDNAFTTESTPILSAVWLSGQEMPTAEPALFTRCILLTFGETKRTETQREAFRKLTRMQEDGLSHLTMNMLQHRNLFAERYQEVYEQTLRDFAAMVNNNDVDERLLGNYAMLLATAGMLDGLGMLPFTMEVFRKQCVDMLMAQFFVLKGSDDTSKFWQVVEQLANAYVLKDDEHFKLANGYIYIYIQDVYHHYVKSMNERREVNVLDKSTLENYLKSDDRSFVARKKMKIGNKYSWAMQFKYEPLEIDLIRGVDEREIRTKMEAMGLQYEEEDLPANDGMPPAVQIDMEF